MMKIVALLTVLLVAGCSNLKPMAIPYPDSTPYDANSLAREAYLQAFAEGYRASKIGTTTPSGFYSGTYPAAREMGWRAGAAAGQQ